MQDHEQETQISLQLSCPACGENLTATPGGANTLSCSAKHEYTLQTLLINQSIRATSLIEASARLLEEQEKLVRTIAQQLWETQSLAAFKLEGQADRLDDTIATLRHVLNEGVPTTSAMKEFTPSSN